MPGTPEEYTRMATADVTLETSLTPRWEDGTDVTAEELREVHALRVYWIRTVLDRFRGSKPQRTAMRLLRSFLSTEQRRQVRSSKSFLLQTASGKTYRLTPKTGCVQRVTRHGSRWFVALSFCLHDDRTDPTQVMPPADLTLAHMLLLHADEEDFLLTANARNARDQLWNPGYLRRLREARRTLATDLQPH